jgi:hypothetical protein
MKTFRRLISMSVLIVLLIGMLSGAFTALADVEMEPYAGESAVVDAQLVAHYSFDDPNDNFAAGGAIRDSSGNEWHGEPAVALTRSSEGVSGGSLGTGGSPHFNAALPAGVVPADNFTLNFWVKSSDKSANWQDWGRLTFSDGSDSDLAELRSPDSVNNWGFYWRDVNAANTSTVNNRVDLKNGQWHMVTVVVAPDDNISLYVDGGNLVRSASKPARDASYSLTNLKIGSGQTGGPAGLLDDVQVYSTALSEAEVALL